MKNLLHNFHDTSLVSEIMQRNHNSQKMFAWFSRLEAVEAKARDIYAKHGYVPSAVLQELTKAELEYALYKAMAKDDDE